MAEAYSVSLQNDTCGAPLRQAQGDKLMRNQ